MSPAGLGEGRGGFDISERQSEPVIWPPNDLVVEFIATTEVRGK